MFSLGLILVTKDQKLLGMHSQLDEHYCAVLKVGYLVSRQITVINLQLKEQDFFIYFFQ